jgi:hypothetical protein
MWVPLPGGDSEQSILENSDLIIKATVDSQYVEEVGGRASASSQNTQYVLLITHYAECFAKVNCHGLFHIAFFGLPKNIDPGVQGVLHRPQKRPVDVISVIMDMAVEQIQYTEVFQYLQNDCDY